MHSVIKRRGRHVLMRENLHDRDTSTKTAVALCSQTAAFRYEKLTEPLSTSHMLTSMK